MENLTGQDNNSIVDNITSLDEAKQLILSLLKTREKMYYFLYVFCNYEIRQPLLSIKGFAELMQRDDLSQEHPDFLKRILQNAEKIMGLIDAVRDATITEWHWGRKSVNENYSLEAIDVNSKIMECITQIQEKLNFENDMRAHYEKTKAKQDIAESAPQIKLTVSIVEDMPVIKYDPSGFDHILLELPFFLIGHIYIYDELFVTANYDEESVKMTFGCSTKDILEHIVKAFQQFETAKTFFEFGDESLPLYNIWYMLKVHGGKLSLDIQDQTDESKHSKIGITISLPR
jgi:hypothetical protein